MVGLTWAANEEARRFGERRIEGLQESQDRRLDDEEGQRVHQVVAEIRKGFFLCAITATVSGFVRRFSSSLAL